MKIALSIITFLLAFSLRGQDYTNLRDKLEYFVDQTIEVRQAVMPIAEKFGFESVQMDSLNRVISFRDSLHLQYVSIVLAENGWLGISEIGKKANISLFLAVQHAEDNKIRERYYPMLEASALKNESSLAQMATMKDRILVQRKLPQRYGTQWNYIGDEAVLFPLEDVNSVNENRTSVGLQPLTDDELKTVQSKYQ